MRPARPGPRPTPPAGSWSAAAPAGGDRPGWPPAPWPRTAWSHRSGRSRRPRRSCWRPRWPTARPPSPARRARPRAGRRWLPLDRRSAVRPRARPVDPVLAVLGRLDAELTAACARADDAAAMILDWLVDDPRAGLDQPAAAAPAGPSARSDPRPHRSWGRRGQPRRGSRPTSPRATRIVGRWPPPSPPRWPAHQGRGEDGSSCSSTTRMRSTARAGWRSGSVTCPRPTISPC